MHFTARSATQVRRKVMRLPHLNFNIFAKPFRYPDAPRFCALPTVSRASCDCKLNCQVFDKEHQLLGLSQFFEVNDMQDDFS
jgi:hypothetical protein